MLPALLSWICVGKQGLSKPTVLFWDGISCTGLDSLLCGRGLPSCFRRRGFPGSVFILLQVLASTAAPLNFATDRLNMRYFTSISSDAVEVTTSAADDLRAGSAPYATMAAGSRRLAFAEKSPANGVGLSAHATVNPKSSRLVEDGKGGGPSYTAVPMIKPYAMAPTQRRAGVCMATVCQVQLVASAPSTRTFHWTRHARQRPCMGVVGSDHHASTCHCHFIMPAPTKGNSNYAQLVRLDSRRRDPLSRGGLLHSYCKRLPGMRLTACSYKRVNMPCCTSHCTVEPGTEGLTQTDRGHTTRSIACLPRVRPERAGCSRGSCKLASNEDLAARLWQQRQERTLRKLLQATTGAVGVSDAAFPWMDLNGDATVDTRDALLFADMIKLVDSDPSLHCTWLESVYLPSLAAAPHQVVRGNGLSDASFSDYMSAVWQALDPKLIYLRSNDSDVMHPGVDCAAAGSGALAPNQFVPELQRFDGSAPLAEAEFRAVVPGAGGVDLFRAFMRPDEARDWRMFMVPLLLLVSCVMCNVRV